MESTKPIIAISSGDINGIGYEIILKGIGCHCKRNCLCISLILNNDG